MACRICWRPRYPERRTMREWPRRMQKKRSCKRGKKRTRPRQRSRRQRRLPVRSGQSAEPSRQTACYLSQGCDGCRGRCDRVFGRDQALRGPCCVEVVKEAASPREGEGVRSGSEGLHANVPYDHSRQGYWSSSVRIETGRAHGPSQRSPRSEVRPSQPSTSLPWTWCRCSGACRRCTLCLRSTREQASSGTSWEVRKTPMFAASKASRPPWRH